MKLRFDDYDFRANEVRVTSKRSIEQDKAGVPFEYTDRIDLDGYLAGTTQQELTNAENQLKTVLLRQGKDLVFFQDDNQPSSVVLRNATAIRQVRVVEGPNFADVNGPEFVSQRHFTFGVEATYPYPSRLGTLLEWTETLSISGGGAVFVVNDAIVGAGQRQQLKEVEKCVATQKGSAVGYDRYPDVPAPIWPFALKRTRPVVDRTTPEKQGASKYRRYRIEWTWEFEWPVELVGVPTLWL